MFNGSSLLVAGCKVSGGDLIGSVLVLPGVRASKSWAELLPVGCAVE